MEWTKWTEWTEWTPAEEPPNPKRRDWGLNIALRYDATLRKCQNKSLKKENLKVRMADIIRAQEHRCIRANAEKTEDARCWMLVASYRLLVAG
jgi:hypothetical protein